MSSTRRAVLLVAGRGRRLGSLTDECPKCMIEVGGMTILERSLGTLSAAGVQRVVLVVGYRAEQIRDVIGDHFSGMDVQYVINERHEDTNTAYSLWRAREFLGYDLLLLEGDILFDSHVLARIIDSSVGESVWAATPIAPGRDEGILLERDDRGYVKSVRLVREADRRDPRLGFKCAGIQLLTASCASAFARMLDSAINAGEIKIFADLVLAEVLRAHAVRLCPLVGIRWAEVDDLEDLSVARRLFGAGPTSLAEAG